METKRLDKALVLVRAGNSRMLRQAGLHSPFLVLFASFFAALLAEGPGWASAEPGY
jgi:hypothetical protein